MQIVRENDIYEGIKQLLTERHSLSEELAENREKLFLERLGDDRRRSDFTGHQMRLQLKRPFKKKKKLVVPSTSATNNLERDAT